MIPLVLNLFHLALNFFERTHPQSSSDSRIEVNGFAILFLQELGMNSQSLLLTSPFLEAGAVISLDKHQ